MLTTAALLVQHYIIDYQYLISISLCCLPITFCVVCNIALTRTLGRGRKNSRVLQRKESTAVLERATFIIQVNIIQKPPPYLTSDKIWQIPMKSDKINRNHVRVWQNCEFPPKSNKLIKMVKNVTQPYKFKISLIWINCMGDLLFDIGVEGKTKKLF